VIVEIGKQKVIARAASDFRAETGAASGSILIFERRTGLINNQADGYEVSTIRVSGWDEALPGIAPLTHPLTQVVLTAITQ